MRIDTNNRLAHYQVEYTECCEQASILQRQIQIKTIEVNQWLAYLNSNNGDAKSRAKYREATRDLSALHTQLRRVNSRLITLQRQINVERNKIQRRR